jgi:hypothetical protein
MDIKEERLVGFMTYVFDEGSVTLKYVPSFTNAASGVLGLTLLYRDIQMC